MGKVKSQEIKAISVETAVLFQVFFDRGISASSPNGLGQLVKALFGGRSPQQDNTARKLAVLQYVNSLAERYDNKHLRSLALDLGSGKSYGYGWSIGGEDRVELLKSLPQAVDVTLVPKDFFERVSRIEKNTASPADIRSLSDVEIESVWRALMSVFRTDDHARRASILKIVDELSDKEVLNLLEKRSGDVEAVMVLSHLKKNRPKFFKQKMSSAFKKRIAVQFYLEPSKQVELLSISEDRDGLYNWQVLEMLSLCGELLTVEAKDAFTKRVLDSCYGRKNFVADLCENADLRNCAFVTILSSKVYDRAIETGNLWLRDLNFTPAQLEKLTKLYSRGARSNRNVLHYIFQSALHSNLDVSKFEKISGLSAKDLGIKVSSFQLADLDSDDIQPL